MSAPSNDLDDPDELREAPAEIKLFGHVIHQKSSPDPPPSPSWPAEAEAEEAEEARVPARLACPRCRSKETKFCYFNNYNVNQPRHFCRSCRRYWTAGGALRNVPVGSGSRGRGHSRPGPYPDPFQNDRWQHNQPDPPDRGRMGRPEAGSLDHGASREK